ncbi:MAG: hypothetical protein JO240_14505 [Solirubrobacterales bacterium]|nr:hypothetical protein [Solirubrobacterales bacterium]
MALGLRLIATLCDELAIVSREGGGIELRLWFGLGPARRPLAPSAPRIGGFGHRSGLSSLLHHHQPAPGLDDRLPAGSS